MNRRAFLQWATRGAIGAAVAAVVPDVWVWPSHAVTIEPGVPVSGMDDLARCFADRVASYRTVRGIRAYSAGGAANRFGNMLIGQQENVAVMLNEHWHVQVMPERGILRDDVIDHAARTMAMSLDRRGVGITVTHVESESLHLASVVSSDTAVTIERDPWGGGVAFYVLGSAG